MLRKAWKYICELIDGWEQSTLQDYEDHRG